MTPQQFIAKWGPGGPSYDLNERQGAQPHFVELCQMLGVPTPGSQGDYIFEQDTLVLGEARGYADVFYRDHFAWENKAPGRNLDAALKQLLTYSLALSNPPLLVVCDRLTTRIHTQFNGHPSEVHTVLLAELDQPEKQALLRRLWLDPESFRPKKTSRDITEAAAKSFATLADGLRKRDNDADEVAHFLTQCLFCFFAEDVGLLPARMFEGLVNNKHLTADKLTQGLTNLFTVMRKGGLYGNDDIPWFNGGLFQRVKVPELSIMEVTELRNAAALNWSAIDVSIFGTLFERGLDPSKRSQLGAHYTDPATILRIVDPVLTRPLLQKWELVNEELRGILAKSTKKGDKNYRAAQSKFIVWLEALKDYRVLDPACGSGNFLFLGLKALKDIEHKSHLDAAALGLDRQADLVTGPHNVLGIELNEYAAELARVTVWIGELQWRIEHGYEFKTNPVLEPLDNIECRDALLTWLPGRPALVEQVGADSGAQAGQRPGAHEPAVPKSPPTSAPPAPRSDVRLEAVEAAWPRASVVVGNPPFLGGSKKRGELGADYFKTLNTVYADRVPGFGDLVCYWFDKALKAIEGNGLGAAGLVTTNSIRGGANRKVLDAIDQRSHIFEAWSDEAWVNDGAAVRVSLICFGNVTGAQLNGDEVGAIHADLTPANLDGSSADLTTAKPLPEAAGTCFMGASKKAPFDIEGHTARDWLTRPNPHGKSNAEVLRPLCNGIDLTRRWGDRWIVDFGTQMPEADATLFEAPYAYVAGAVRPIAIKNSDKQVARNWWRHARPRVDMRTALAPLPRFIITAAVAKHRTFIWMHTAVLPDQATLATARADDTTFGILHSRFHELWSLRMCTWLGVGNDPRYTPTTCFETFPFPAGLTPADTAHQRTETLEDGSVIPASVFKQNQAVAPVGSIHIATNTVATATAIARAAKRLNDLREAWLNPAEWTDRVPEVTPLGMTTSPYPDRILPKPGFEKQLAERTLTKLYNQRPAWLNSAHQTLDKAVAAAYGWADYTPDMPDEEILKRLLALNLERSKAAIPAS